MDEGALVVKDLRDPELVASARGNPSLLRLLAGILRLVMTIRALFEEQVEPLLDSVACIRLPISFFGNLYPRSAMASARRERLRPC